VTSSKKRECRSRLTDRLRLEPIGAEHADDLWKLHQDDAIAQWYGGKWTVEAAQRQAVIFERGWAVDGASKWIAYDRESGELVGRGGLSRVEVDGELRLELGWAICGDRWGQGYATEIGQAGLSFAFDELGADEVVAFTELHNTRSRAVMDRLGMHYVKEFVQDGESFVLYVLRRSGSR
jgi:RimJ/RimL family protein N-acetyltransferase